MACRRLTPGRCLPGSYPSRLPQRAPNGASFTSSPTPTRSCIPITVPTSHSPTPSNQQPSHHPKHTTPPTHPHMHPFPGTLAHCRDPAGMFQQCFSPKWDIRIQRRADTLNQLLQSENRNREERGPNSPVENASDRIYDILVFLGVDWDRKKLNTSPAHWDDKHRQQSTRLCLCFCCQLNSLSEKMRSDVYLQAGLDSTISISKGQFLLWFH